MAFCLSWSNAPENETESSIVCSVCLIQIALHKFFFSIIPEINISNFQVFGWTAKVRNVLLDHCCHLENEMVLSEELLIKSHHCSTCYLGNWSGRTILINNDETGLMRLDGCGTTVMSILTCVVLGFYWPALNVSAQIRQVFQPFLW